MYTLSAPKGVYWEILPLVQYCECKEHILGCKIPALGNGKSLGPQGMYFPIDPSSWQCTDTIPLSFYFIIEQNIINVNDKCISLANISWNQCLIKN